MKLLFIQLSDMHCQVSNDTMVKKLEKAVAAINTLGKEMVQFLYSPVI